MSHVAALQLMKGFTGRLVPCPRSDRDLEGFMLSRNSCDDPNWLSATKLPPFPRAGKEKQKESPGVLAWSGAGCSC